MTRLTSAFVLLFGVLLPGAAVVIEAVTGMCGDIFFDPIPTTPHALIVALVPLANLLAWFAATQGSVKHLNKIGVANGLALGISLVYSLIFLPLSPVGVLGIVAYGLGLLPLAPFFAFAAAIVCRRELKCIAEEAGDLKVRGAWWGFAVGILILLALEAPYSYTHLAMRMAASDSPELQRKGVRILRTLGHHDYMLQACYVRGTRPTGLSGLAMSFGDPLTPSEARVVYYRVTGRPFNEAPVPRALTRRRTFWFRTFDRGLGGMDVAGKVAGLSLHSSRMDGSIDADAALAYLEWTLEFRNTSVIQHEARGQVLLPPGGVVSRLTLWVDGQEREAAFAARGRVRDAYRRVVRQRRDPVLVTTSGPDRVMVQCFPVPPGGEMKIRLGVTAPLVLNAGNEGRLHLPQLIETNFTTPKGFRHVVWVEARQPLGASSEDLAAETPKPDLFAVRGNVREAQLAQTGVHVTAKRSDAAVMAWTPDPLDNAYVVTQALTPQEASVPSRVVFVIDGSAGMTQSVPSVAEAVASLPEGIEFAAIVASDEPHDLAKLQKGTTGAYERLAGDLRALKFVGGCDNVPALERAWDIAAQSANGAVVWIHAAVPVELSPVAGLQQRWDRRPDAVRLFDVQAASGPNVILKEFDGFSQVESRRDLKALMRLWAGKQTRLAFVRKRIGRDAASEVLTGAKRTSAHLARLWAYEQIRRRDRRTPDPKGVKARIKLAADYHLVTPLTGAVVLETEEQFKDAGLEPAPEDSVPTIPEPETVLLMIVVALVLLFAVIRRRVACVRA